jgi:hypothetical protein
MHALLPQHMSVFQQGLLLSASAKAVNFQAPSKVQQ